VGGSGWDERRRIRTCEEKLDQMLLFFPGIGGGNFAGFLPEIRVLGSYVRASVIGLARSAGSGSHGRCKSVGLTDGALLAFLLEFSHAWDGSCLQFKHGST
jgi:hypothetical protein